MAVTDWNADSTINSDMSNRFSRARFTVLIDEEFDLGDNGLPIKVASGKIERITINMSGNDALEVGRAKLDSSLPNRVAARYQSSGYLHLYIQP